MIGHTNQALSPSQQMDYLNVSLGGARKSICRICDVYSSSMDYLFKDIFVAKSLDQ